MGDSIHFERFDKIVSLGTDCTVGIAFKAEGSKAETYPFDWVISHYRWLHDQLDRRLPWPLDGGALTVYDEATPHVLADERGGVFYYHDFTADPSPEQVEAVRAKYRRRADRFNDLLDSGRRVLLVRTHLQNSRYAERDSAGSTDQIDVLAEILERRYPGADFRVLMLYSTGGDRPQHPRVTRIRVPGDKDGFRRHVARHIEKVRENQPGGLPAPSRI